MPTDETNAQDPPVPAPGLETRRIQAAIGQRLFGEAHRDSDPICIGRFEICDMLGEGGMGTVYQAHDPQLERMVAIKVLRDDGRRTDEDSARLLREAKAMAQLSHPNVVTVHESGIIDQQVYLVMEYVAGITLRQWCERHPPGSLARFEQVLDFARQAAQGLAAAHAAGLVHRDLKPANMLVGDDDRLRVADFGLARAAETAVTMPDVAELAPPGVDGDSLDPVGRLTATGEVMGTPAYMAPEQFGGQADASSDQFSFCATIFEAIYGIRPFKGGQVAVLLGNILAGRVRPPSTELEVPPWIWKVLERGLAADPHERYASMHALVAALDPRPARRRGWWLGLGSLGIGIAAAALMWPSDEPEVPRCERGQSLLSPMWGAERRDEIERALRDHASYGGDTWTRIAPIVDDYTQEWISGFYDACTAVQAGEAGADRRLGCLERAQEQLAVVSAELAGGQPDTLRHAAALVLSLPRLESCRDPASAGLDTGSLEDPALRELAQDIGRAIVLAQTARHREATALLEDIVTRAQAQSREALQTRATLLLSSVAFRTGDYEASWELGKEGLALAERLGDDAQQLDAWRRLAAASRKLSQLDRASFELDRAEALLDHPGVLPVSRGHNHYDRAVLLSALGQRTEALAEYDQALAIYTEHLAENHPNFSNVLGDMAMDLMRSGQQAKALTVVQRAVELKEAELGPTHPMLAIPLANLADQYISASRFEEALELHRRALELMRQHPDERRVDRVSIIAMVGQDLVALGRFDEAEKVLAQGAREAEQLGEDHSSEALIALVRGNAAFDKRDFAAAIPHYERSLAIVRTRPRGRDNRVPVLANLLVALAQTGRHDDAMVLLDELRGLLDGISPASPVRAGAQLYIGDALRLGGRDTEARVSYELAIESLLQVERSPRDLAQARFGLARVHPDPARARDLAEQARPVFANTPGSEVERREVEAWLATHPAP